jgi:hypothetical protein
MRNAIAEPGGHGGDQDPAERVRDENDPLERPHVDVGDYGVNGISERDLGDVRRLGAPTGKVDGERWAVQQWRDAVPDPAAEHRTVE